MINWKAKLQDPRPRVLLRTQTDEGHVDRPATLADVREFLQAVGLDLTTRDALAWGTRFVKQAKGLTRICELQQRVSDLQHLLRTRRHTR